MPSNVERIPPQSLEAEQSLLGALLLDKDAMIKVGDVITPDDFYADNHRLIFEAMVDLFKEHAPIDLISLSNLLTERQTLERIGGRAYLVELSNSVPTASHAPHYAAIIGKKATLRRLLQAAGEITGLGFTEDEDVENLLDQAEQKLFNVSQKFLKASFTGIKELLGDAFDRIDALHKDAGKVRGIPTNFADLDRLLGGLQNSDLVVLAARPSCGKTAFALDIARQAAKKGTAVGIFSLEMGKEQLVDRIIASEANVNLWSLRNGKLSSDGTNDEFARIGHALGVLSESPIYIDDTASANIMEIRTKSRRLQMERGLGMIIIDYLQLMESRSGTADNRVNEVAMITRGLKGIARELNVPVIALSQLSRQVELTKPAIPKLAHLRESGSIEQDADVVLFIYRKAADKNYRIEDLAPEERHIAEIHVAKHRNGPTGIVKLFFDENRASFRNLERKAIAPIPPPTPTPVPNP